MTRRLTLVIHSLEGGGAERIAAWMANHWCEQGDQVTLITLAAVGTDQYRVAAGVRRIGLNLLSVSRNSFQAVARNLLRVKRLAAAIADSQPERIVSFTDKTNVLALLACRGQAVRPIAYELVDPRHHDIGTVWSWLRRWTYPSARALVVQTAAVRDWFRSWLPRLPIFVIPTGVPAPTPVAVAKPPHPHLLAVGRLEPQKGFDLLIDAFSRIAATHPDWHLWIAGEGSQHVVLAREIRRRGLENRIHLLGRVAEPELLMRQAELFVLSSRYEGFPTALLEAMAHGLPAVCFDCPSGPAEIVRHSQDGILVPPEDVSALAAALARLMDDPNLRRSMGQQAQDVVQRFSAEQFFRRWEEALA
ncbi:MAG: glycosyl transferase [Pirellulaceae bacterium]|nr:MAG: glycosyl transferase [Pirellulaceae bacterium]